MRQTDKKFADSQVASSSIVLDVIVGQMAL